MSRRATTLSAGEMGTVGSFQGFGLATGQPSLRRVLSRDGSDCLGDDGRPVNPSARHTFTASAARTKATAELGQVARQSAGPCDQGNPTHRPFSPVAPINYTRTRSDDPCVDASRGAAGGFPENHSCAVGSATAGRDRRFF